MKNYFVAVSTVLLLTSSVMAHEHTKPTDEKVKVRMMHQHMRDDQKMLIQYKDFDMKEKDRGIEYFVGSENIETVKSIMYSYHERMRDLRKEYADKLKNDPEQLSLMKEQMKIDMDTIHQSMYSAVQEYVLPERKEEFDAHRIHKQHVMMHTNMEQKKEHMQMKKIRRAMK